MVKKILLFVLVAAIIGVCTGIYLWRKPEEKVEDKKTNFSSSAVDISKAYTANEKKADSMYLDKTLEVSGAVTEVSRNQDSAIVVVLDSGDPMSGVQCTMRERNVNVNKGQNIIVKGLCKGNNMGVVLTRCVIK